MCTVWVTITNNCHQGVMVSLMFAVRPTCSSLLVLKVFCESLNKEPMSDVLTLQTTYFRRMWMKTANLNIIKGDFSNIKLLAQCYNLTTKWWVRNLT